MIDIRQLRENPERFRQGARDKNAAVDFDRLLTLDTERREILQKLESKRAEQNKLSKEIGPQIGKLKGQLKGMEGAARTTAEAQLTELEAKPIALKGEVALLEDALRLVEPHWNDLLLRVPQPPAADIPRGADARGNV